MAKEPKPMTEAQAEALDGDGDGKPGGSLEQLTTYLTARHSAEFGPQGHFVDAKPSDVKKHTEGDDPILVLPSLDQLALRRL